MAISKGRENKFIKIKHHLKSSQIDEKLELLNEIPTNNTTGFYFISPEVTEVIPPVLADLDLTADANPDGTDTSGLFGENGEILTEQPPGDNSYILGPMVSVYFPDGDYTAIGYIQENTRKVINLARISGPIETWNGVDGFVSYSQLTLEQANWYKGKFLTNKVQDYRVFYIGIFEPIEPQVYDPGVGVDLDNLGRWLGKIIKDAKTLISGGISRTPAITGGPDPNIVPGLANPLKNLSSIPSSLLNAFGNFFEPLSALAYAGSTFSAFLLQQQGVTNFTRQNPYETSLPPQDAQNISNALNDVMQTIPRERWENLNGQDLAKINAVLNPTSGPTPSNPDRPKTQFTNTDEYHNIVNNIGRSDAFAGQIKKDKNGNEYISGISDNYVFTNDADASVKGAPELIKFFGQAFGAQSDPNRAGGGTQSYVGTNEPGAFDVSPNAPPVTNIKLKNMPIQVNLPAPSGMNVSTYNPAGGGMGGKRGTGISESKNKSILKELKKPYSLPEEKEQKIRRRPRVIGSSSRIVGQNLMKSQKVEVPFKDPQDRVWGKYEKNQNAKRSQERKNMILDSIGTSDHAWEWLTETSKKKNKDIMYGNFDIKKSLGKESESVKDKIISKEQIGNDYLIRMFDDNGQIITITQSVLNERLHKEFEKRMLEQQSLQADKDPLFKRVANKLKPIIDYPDKPAKLGYPNELPPPMINGWHPEFGDKVDYYKKLDPHSADTMNIPKTNNSEIDKTVEKQTTSRIKKVKKIIKNK